MEDKLERFFQILFAIMFGLCMIGLIIACVVLVVVAWRFAIQVIFGG